MSMVAKLKKQIQSQVQTPAPEAVTFRIPAELNERLGVVAARLDQSKNWIVVNLLQQLCDESDAENKTKK